MRLQEQRKLTDTLMKTKTQLMYQFNTEVQRNGSLVKENAELSDAMEQQQQQIAAKKRKLKMKIKHYKDSTTTQQLQQQGTHEGRREKGKEKRDVEERDSVVVVGEARLSSSSGHIHSGRTASAGASLSIVPTRKQDEVVVLKASGWFSWLPFFGRKTFHKTCEIVV